MGVEGLIEFLNKKAPDGFKIVNVSNFSGSKIAIDANQWISRHMFAIWGSIVSSTDVAIEEPNPELAYKRTIDACLAYIKKLYGYNIIPVFVFDGVAPPEKMETKAKRNEDRETNRLNLQKKLSEVRNTSIFGRGDADLEYDKELKKLYSKVVPYFGESQREMLKNIFYAFGVPFVTAVGEGERLCAMLCRDGIVSGVHSTDCDNLALGCPIWIKGFTKDPIREGDNLIHQFEIVHLPTILKSLELTLEQFIDICIIMGCDFNLKERKEKLSGYGAGRAYKLIKEGSSIDNIQGIDLTPLRHHRCRQLFLYEPYTKCMANGILDYSTDYNFSNLGFRKELLSGTGFESQWNTFNTYIQNPIEMAPSRILSPINHGIINLYTRPNTIQIPTL